MKISRRTFLKFGTLATVFTGTDLFTSVSAAQTKLADDNLTLSEFSDPFSIKTAEDFRQYVGAEFMLLRAKSTTSIILSEISEASKNVKSSARSKESSKGRSSAKNFVLSFQFPTGKFKQETYQLWHPDFGQFDLFLVPGKHTAPFLMHAVINRL